MDLRDEIRECSVAICREIDEDEAYIVRTSFDALIGARKPFAALTDEGQFEIPSEAVTYASLVVSFVGGIFADAVKDAAKEQLVAGLRRWLKAKQPDTGEDAVLRGKLLAAIDDVEASDEQRRKLMEAVTAMFR